MAILLGVSTHYLYKWIKGAERPTEMRHRQPPLTEALRRLKVEPTRVTEERNSIKGRSVLCRAVRVRYAHSAYLLH